MSSGAEAAVSTNFLVGAMLGEVEGKCASAVGGGVLPLIPGQPPFPLPGPGTSDMAGSQASHLIDCLDLGPPGQENNE